ncbi:MAG: dodecin domain-containing protein [Planctomycetales bacterium]|nr:dodecin domain-containing protein [Planctomycetales bacterium]
MSKSVYKHIEITGTSNSSMEEAVQTAVERAATTVQNMRWFEIVDSRGSIEDGRVSEWQVTIKIGFTLND